jgi:hypothetical protein
MKRYINKKNLLVIISIIIGFLIGGLFSSCKKEPITPGNYQAPVPPPIDTTHWENEYTNGGTTPINNNGNNTNTNDNNNGLVGTNWVVTKFLIGFSTTTPNDTIHFISDTKYSVNIDTTKFNYTFYVTEGNATISFYPFRPINSLNLTSNNIGYNVFKNVPISQEVVLILKDLFSTPTKQYTTTFKKI